ncbi:MAG: hypothetical protein HY330_02745 [Chloroflexi bacterium]|nr:hypothetical protein [Chloroflexota bacterium]
MLERMVGFDWEVISESLRTPAGMLVKVLLAVSWFTMAAVLIFLIIIEGGDF